jgi:hypothetical protein
LQNRQKSVSAGHFRTASSPAKIMQFRLEKKRYEVILTEENH